MTKDQKYAQLMIAGQTATALLDLIIQNLSKHPKYYEDCETLLLRHLTQIKDRINEALSDDI
jgi:hypothetical protein